MFVHIYKYRHAIFTQLRIRALILSKFLQVKNWANQLNMQKIWFQYFFYLDINLELVFFSITNQNLVQESIPGMALTSLPSALDRDQTQNLPLVSHMIYR